eukprot:gene35292-43511_t
MPKASAPPAELPTPASYEAALEELEQLVGRIENGQMPLEQLLSGYQRGAQLLAFCRERLEAVESQVKAFDLGGWSAQRLARVEEALSQWVVADAPAGLGESMRYAVLDGGKRLRPLLVLAASEAVNGNPDAALRAACAVELIHAYSLVHDDMPCMDDDVLRRGKPTVHVKFGEAPALLAGDALQAFAFELLTPDNTLIPAATQATLCRLLARAAGSAGMAGGRAIGEGFNRLHGAQGLEEARAAPGAVRRRAAARGTRPL